VPNATLVSIARVRDSAITDPKNFLESTETSHVMNPT